MEDRMMLTVFTVNTLDDEAFDGTGTDGTDGAGLSLREAIGLANSNTVLDTVAGQGEADGDAIIFSPALAGGTITISTTSLMITDDVAINGDAGTAGTRITIDGGGTIGVLIIGTMDSAGDSDAVLLQNLVVQNGTAIGGGGISNQVGSPTTLNNVIVQNNTAGALGGGISNLGSLSIEGGSLLTGNVAGLNGGAILNQGTLSVDASTIQANTAGGDGGGGIFSISGTVSITGSTITANIANGTAGSGGGISIAAGDLTIDQSIITLNSSIRAGGGIETGTGPVTLTITDSNLDNNVTLGSATAPGNGGAIHVTGAAITNITGGTISGNSAANEGGGLWNSATGTMTVDSVTITGNVASGPSPSDGGGGIFNNGGTLNVTGSTITGNIANGAAGTGGGILNFGLLDFADTVLTGNTASESGGGIQNELTLRLSGTNTTLGINSPDTISGAGDVLIEPTGTVTFAAGTTSTHTGTTTLSSGTTVVDGTLDASGAGVTVQTGATLSGTGTIDRAIIINSGGILAPGGDLIGILDAADTDFVAGSTLEIQVNGVAVAGVDYDQLNVTGTVDVDGANLALSGTVTGTAAGDAVVIINNDGADLVTGEFVGLADGDSVTINGETFTIFYNGGDGNDVVLAAAPALVGAVFVNDDFTGVDGTIIADADPNTAGAQMAVIGINAFDTIQEGVDAVDSGGTVSITDDLATDGPGTYTENVVIDKDVTIAGTEGDPTAVIVDGGAAGSVITINATFTATLDSITIQNGSALNGGGINNLGNLNLLNSIVQDNIATGTVSGNGGGGIFSASGTVMISSSEITGNAANLGSGSGGGIFIETGTVTIDQSQITFNTANRAGGGIEINTGSLTITESNLDDNSAVGPPGNGGAIHVTGNATVSLTGGTVAGNSAANEGGGLWNSASGTMTVNTVSITGNTAGVEGGGIFNNGGTLNITGATIGDSIIENDVFSTPSVSAGNLVFAFVDTQDSTAGTGVLLDVLEDDGTTIIDNFNAGITAGGTVVQGGDLFFNVQGDPLSGEAVTPFQLYATAVSPTFVVEEAEPNDDSVTATAIIEETLVTGTLTAADADVFSISVAAGSSLVAILDSLAGTDAVLEILDTDGTTVLATGTVDEFSLDSAVIASGLAGGTYFIRVTGDAGATGDYQFVALVAAPGDQVSETEPNDEPADANVFLVEQFVEGSLLQVGPNTALRGGGIFNNTGGTVNVTGLTLINNNTATGTASTDGGGGIYNDGGTVTVDDLSRITFNSATAGAGSGGGIFNNIGGTLTVTDATIAGNTANRAGGGIEDASGAGFGTTLTNVNLNDNVALGAPGNGGGLHVSGAADIDITGGSVSGNSAALEGGGLWNGGGIMTITGTAIDGNTASGAAADDGGGGIFNNGGDVVITGASSITNNVANGTAGSGGGIFNNIGGTITATGTVITGNTANRAGGGIEDASSAGLGITLNGVTLDNNVALGAPGNGGGLHVSGTGDVMITGGSVSGNSAALEGGGLWNGTGTMTIDSVTIDGNTAGGAAADDGGGGIFNNGGTIDLSNSTVSNNLASGAAGAGGGLLSVGGTVLTSNVTISGNSATGEGGGIQILAGTATINNSTIADNQAGAGGGINVESGTVSLNSTIVATNLAGTSGSDITGAVTGTFNLIGVDTGLTGLTDGVDNNQVGTSATPIDALLGPLADNGGPTLTHILLPGSPAIDAGSNPDNLDFDQRLSPFERVVGDQADVGAIELQQVGNDIIVVGTDAGGEVFVQVFDADTQTLLFTLVPYPGFTCGVRVAVGDVNFDGTPDIITAPGEDGGPHIRVFSGVDGSDLGSFFAYSESFTGGVYVASADIDGDGFSDIITGAGPGGGPHVRVFSGANFSDEIASFFAFGGFAGGVRVAAGDINDDGTPDIIVGAGPGAGPHVRVFDGANPLDGNDPVVDIGGLRGSFYAFDPVFGGGVFVAAGDVDNDDQVDIIVGADAGAGPHVRVFDGETGLQLAGPIGSFYAFDQSFTGGVRVAASDVNGDGAADIVTTQGPGGEPRLRVYDGASIGTPTLLVDTLVDDANVTDGLFPAASVELESSTVTTALDDLFADGDLLDDLV